MLDNVNKKIDFFDKLQNLLPRATLITIYKDFVRPFLDYEEVLYDQTFNSSFHQKPEFVQFNSCLAWIRKNWDTSKKEIYQKLVFESLWVRRWNGKLGLCYKSAKNNYPQHLLNFIPTRINLHTIRNMLNIPQLEPKEKFFFNIISTICYYWMEQFGSSFKKMYKFLGFWNQHPKICTGNSKLYLQ